MENVVVVTIGPNLESAMPAVLDRETGICTLVNTQTLRVTDEKPFVKTRLKFPFSGVAHSFVIPFELWKGTKINEADFSLIVERIASKD